MTARAVLHADVEVTRRKRMHLIEIEGEGVSYHSRYLSECILWLWDRGYEHVGVVTSEAGFSLTISPDPQLYEKEREARLVARTITP